MKYFLLLSVFAFMVVYIQADWCGSTPDCGEGMCCSGGSYNRHCRPLADNGTPCQQPNRWNQYSTGCPCKKGLVCSAINYCQPEM